jgi:hypothetical protein
MKETTIISSYETALGAQLLLKSEDICILNFS